MTRRLVSFVCVLGLFYACSGDEEKLDTTHAGGAAGTGATDAALGGGGGSVLGGAGGGDAAVTGGSGGFVIDTDATFDGPRLADAGWFDCYGCACDGTTHYCLSWSAGIAAPPLPDAATCDDSSHCTPLPSDCLAPPSCSCVGYGPSDPCFCEDSGGGLLVQCSAP